MKLTTSIKGIYLDTYFVDGLQTCQSELGLCPFLQSRYFGSPYCILDTEERLLEGENGHLTPIPNCLMRVYS